MMGEEKTKKKSKLKKRRKDIEKMIHSLKKKEYVKYHRFWEWWGNEE